MNNNAKPTVDLGPDAPKGSRIRRDPPPPPSKDTIVRFRSEHEQVTVIAGVVFFALAMFIIIVNFSDYLNRYF